MSKRLARQAVNKIVADFYPSGGIHGDGKKFKLKTPSQGSLDTFNAIRVLDVDSFAGVRVCLIEIVNWSKLGSRIFENDEGKVKMYPGSHDGALPADVQALPSEYFLVVTSLSLQSNLALLRARLNLKGCQIQQDARDAVFMLLRAFDLIVFDDGRRDEATLNISFQPESPEYTGTDLPELYPYYEAFSVFRVADNSVLLGRSIFWYSYQVAASWKGVKGRYFSEEATESIERIYEQSLWSFPIDNARLAITTAHFKHSYIELYRCIEWLYSLPRCIRVKAQLGVAIKATQLAKSLRETLAWRRKEQDSLDLLINDARIETLNRAAIKQALGPKFTPYPAPGATADELEKWRITVSDALSTRLYKLRNQFVHQLDADDLEAVDFEAEVGLIQVLAELCTVLYGKYAGEF